MVNTVSILNSITYCIKVLCESCLELPCFIIFSHTVPRKDTKDFRRELAISNGEKTLKSGRYITVCVFESLFIY